MFPRVYLNCFTFLALVSLITKHLSELKCICQSCSHLVNSSRSFCSSAESNWLLISRYRTQSSANRRTVEWILPGRLLMYIRKRSGPSSVRSGTPDLTWVQGDCSPLTTTLCSWHVRNLEIQACVLLLIPYLFSLFRSRLWGIVSNAFEKSIMIMSTCHLLFSDLDRSCVVTCEY